MNKIVFYSDYVMDVEEIDGEFYCPHCGASISNNHMETCINCKGFLNWPNYSGVLSDHRMIIVTVRKDRYCPNGCKNQKDNYCSICKAEIQVLEVKKPVLLSNKALKTPIDLPDSGKCPTCEQRVGVLGGVPDQCKVCGQKFSPSEHASLSLY